MLFKKIRPKVERSAPSFLRLALVLCLGTDEALPSIHSPAFIYSVLG